MRQNEILHHPRQLNCRQAGEDSPFESLNAGLLREKPIHQRVVRIQLMTDDRGTQSDAVMLIMKLTNKL
ncbi:hypothetical protein D9M73_244750 [compost metagenome]